MSIDIQTINGIPSIVTENFNLFSVKEIWKILSRYDDGCSKDIISIGYAIDTYVLKPNETESSVSTRCWNSYKEGWAILQPVLS